MPTVTRLPYDSPCGELLLEDLDGVLLASDWTQGRHRPTTLRRTERLLAARFGTSPVVRTGETERLRETARLLDAYFAGERPDFRTVPLLLLGTDLQRDVWRALADIPYGAAETYGELARRIGRPKAVRAVGTAVGANPFSILLPCHRILGAGRSLTGYGGGLDAKRFLLSLEGIDFVD